MQNRSRWVTNQMVSEALEVVPGVVLEAITNR